MRGTSRTMPVLSDWTLLIRFDDGSVAELVSPAGPDEMCAKPAPQPLMPHRSLRGRMGDTLHGVGVAARRLAAGER